MLKLHAFDRSPYAWKARMALAEKNVPYEQIVPQNKNEDPAFLKLNPMRLTPVLELEDGRTVYESTVVNEYIEEAFPGPALLPKDPWERARVRMLEDTTDQYVMAALGGVRSSQFDYQPPFLVRKPAAQVDQKLLEESRMKVHTHLARLEGELAGRAWFGGDTFSLADIGLVPVLTGGLVLLGILPDAKYPNIAAWSKRVSERPSFKASAPKEPLRIKEA
jgi:glutathione S-transferase